MSFYSLIRRLLPSADLCSTWNQQRCSWWTSSFNWFDSFHKHMKRLFEMKRRRPSSSPVCFFTFYSFSVILTCISMLLWCFVSFIFLMHHVAASTAKEVHTEQRVTMTFSHHNTFILYFCSRASGRQLQSLSVVSRFLKCFPLFHFHMNFSGCYLTWRYQPLYSVASSVMTHLTEFLSWIIGCFLPKCTMGIVVYYSSTATNLFMLYCFILIKPCWTS